MEIYTWNVIGAIYNFLPFSQYSRLPGTAAIRVYVRLNKPAAIIYNTVEISMKMYTGRFNIEAVCTLLWPTAVLYTILSSND